MQCSTHALQHSAEQGSILPHRTHPAEAYPLDVCRHLQDTLMYYEPRAAGAFDWSEYLEHPTYERLGEDLRHQLKQCPVFNYEQIEMVWAMVCTEVVWALCRDHGSRDKHECID
eukprot:10445045-Heterocapsa_arctica.AAC.1